MVYLINQDLEFAKSKLLKEDLNLVIVKNGQLVFKTKKEGIIGILESLDTLDKELINSSIADKIVGMAASMLFVYAKVSAVFTQLISDPGLKILQENNIASQFEKRVPNILNHRQNDVCPFEKQAIASKTVEEAYHNLRSFANQKKLKKR